MEVSVSKGFSLTSFSLQRPEYILFVVVSLMLFGVYSLFEIPVRLVPDLDEPKITVVTNWAAGSPEEVEAEILIQQENVIKGLFGLQEMRSSANQGYGFIDLTFNLGTDMNETLVDLVARLNRVPSLPRDVVPPQIYMGGFFGGKRALTNFYLQKLPGNTESIQKYVELLENVVSKEIETIPGVASVKVKAGDIDKQLDIVYDPVRAAKLGITVANMSLAIKSAEDASSGTIKVGKRNFSLKYKGRKKLSELENIIVKWADDRPIKLGDFASVYVQHIEVQGFAIQNGNPAIYFQIYKDDNANSLEVLNQVNKKIEKINQGIGISENVKLVQSFDSTVFIERSVSQLTSSLLTGIGLAVLILWLFLRSFKSTIAIAAIVPICIVTTILVIYLSGRTINIISLAGLALSVGLLLDAGIIVVENIIRVHKGVTSQSPLIVV
ncbi:efflux RND transporter permease subunit [Pseudoalteromonas piscicida]|nr:efflux RND transporter permease subunit [Pseudoalteromonas piscicida]